jgi:hypothetical protein
MLSSSWVNHDNSHLGSPLALKERKFGRETGEKMVVVVSRLSTLPSISFHAVTDSGAAPSLPPLTLIERD